MLTVREITLRFGGIVALDGVSFDVQSGQISGLIGPNGAGKTTAFNVITRLYNPDGGQLELDGRSLLGTPPHRIVRRGIARTFQNINLFKSMSVLDNVLVGAHAVSRNASSSPGRSPRSLACSCSTSRPAGSTTRRWRSSATSSCGCVTTMS
jgi:branched-chain amino acid transport system ATP-binding protein